MTRDTDHNVPDMLHGRTRLACAATGVLLAGGTALGAVPSLEQIRAGVLVQRELLSTFEVQVVSSRVSGPGHAVARSEESLLWSDGWFVLKIQHGTDPDAPADGPERWSIHDGEQGIHYWGVTGNAKVMGSLGELHQFSDLEGSDFFGALAWYPVAEVTTGSAGPRDLLEVVSNPAASVRPIMETVRGFECVVVDAPGEASPSATLWLAVNHGYAPVRQIHYNGLAPSMIRETDALATLENGAVIPTVGRRIVNPRQGDPDLGGGLEYAFHVPTDDAGLIAASVGPIAPDAFDADAILPPGTAVHSADLSTVYVVAGRTFSDSADQVLAAQFGDVRPELSAEIAAAPRLGTLLALTLSAALAGILLAFAPPLRKR